jgi:hypothetical protein
MAIAEMLGKYEWEILNIMPLDEFYRWVAYIQLCNERDERILAKGRRGKQ